MPQLVITGLKELDRKLKELPARVAGKVTRQALREGAKLIRAQAVANAPVGETGLLKRSIKVRARKRSRNAIGIDVRTGEGDFKGKTYYSAFQEYGTSKMPGKGYMRRAVDEKGEAAKQLVIQRMKEGIEREAKG